MKQLKKSSDKPRVGVAVIIKQNSQVILAKRSKQPMPGSWQLPGGWLHFTETPEQAVTRHLQQFTGLLTGKSSFLTFTNNLFDEYTHTLSLYFMVDCLNKDPQMMLNNTKGDWIWADWNNLPEPLFLPLHLLKQSEISMDE